MKLSILFFTSLIVPTLTLTHSSTLKKLELCSQTEEFGMGLTQKRCKACEGGVKPMTIKEEDDYLDQVSDWDINREEVHTIQRKFVFKNFKESLEFVNAVGVIAEEEGHHPDIAIFYNRVTLELYTHAIKGLSENDFILASKIDELIKKMQHLQG